VNDLHHLGVGSAERVNALSVGCGLVQSTSINGEANSPENNG
jgi:hypothetical protein